MQISESKKMTKTQFDSTIIQIGGTNVIPYRYVGCGASDSLSPMHSNPKI